MEIEKKYLFDNLPMAEEFFEHFHLIQAYISRDPVIRIRSISRKEEGQEIASHVLTIKGSGLTMREEHELILSRQQFENLMKKAEGRIIEKTRYLVPLENGLTAEADIFEGDHAGLKLVEVEFSSEEEMNAFTPPEWFGKDVSGTNRYHNSELSKG